MKIKLAAVFAALALALTLSGCATLKERLGIDFAPDSEAPAVTDLAAACSARASSVWVVTRAVNLGYFDDRQDQFQIVDEAVTESRPYCSKEALAAVIADPATANDEAIRIVRETVTKIIGAQVAAAIGADTEGMSAAVTDQIAALIAAGFSVSEIL